MKMRDLADFTLESNGNDGQTRTAMKQGYTKLNDPRPLDANETYVGEQGADPVTNQFYTEDSDGFLPRHHGLSR
jgi:hypothetical protein